MFRMSEHQNESDWQKAFLDRVHAYRDDLASSHAKTAHKIEELDMLLRLLCRFFGHHHHHPHHRKLVLLQPTFTTLNGEPLMAAYPLKLDVVAHFVLTETNAATGALDPVNPTDVFTVVSSDPTNLQAVVGTNAAGQTEIAVNWLHTTNPMLTGVGISITDSAGNIADNAETFDMVAPAFVPDQIGIDIANVTETPQAVPV